MILYHYTGFYELQNGGTILKEGLKPSAPETNPLDIPGGVVWLTTETDPVWWDEGHTPREVRITLVIPSRDRALVPFEKWLNRKRPGLVETVARTGHEKGLRWREWYLYFGAIPLSRIRRIEATDPAHNRPELQNAAVGPQVGPPNERNPL